MRLGFLVDYAKPTTVYVATRLAERFHATTTVSLWGHGRLPSWVANSSRRFLRSAKDLSCAEWQARQDTTLCVGLPEAPRLRALRKQVGRQLLFWFVLYDDLPHLAAGAAVERFDYTVCPLRSMRKFLRREQGLKNTCYIPWEPGYPITLREAPQDCGCLRLYLPWLSGPNGTLAEAAVLVRNLLETTNHQVTIAASRSLPPGALLTSKRLQRKFPDRFRVLRVRNEQERLVHLAEHDLLLWLPCVDPLGELIVESLYRGVPVISSDFGPAAELLSPGRSGLVIPPRKVDLVRNCYPMGSPDFAGVLACLKDKKKLQTAAADAPAHGLRATEAADGERRPLEG